VVGQATFEIGEHLGDDLTGGRPGLVGEVAVELDEQRDQVDVGLDALQQFGLEQELAEIETFDGVSLKHLHHRRRKVPADVTQPAHHRRFRPAQSPGAARPASAVLATVVQRAEGGIDPSIVATQAGTSRWSARWRSLVALRAVTVRTVAIAGGGLVAGSLAVGFGPHVVDGGTQEEAPPAPTLGFRHRWRRHLPAHGAPTPSI